MLIHFLLHFFKLDTCDMLDPNIFNESNLICFHLSRTRITSIKLLVSMDSWGRMLNLPG